VSNPARVRTGADSRGDRTVSQVADGLDRTLAALADPCRRQVVDLLRESPRRAGDLAAATRVSFPAMSRHLRTLRASGLVAEERDEFDSRVRIYRLRPEPMADLKKWLQETEALWSRQLESLRDHLRKP
jgi:DNA-binding transcriptional ArsR family regulator